MNESETRLWEKGSGTFFMKPMKLTKEEKRVIVGKGSDLLRVKRSLNPALRDWFLFLSEV